MQESDDGLHQISAGHSKRVPRWAIDRGKLKGIYCYTILDTDYELSAGVRSGSLPFPFATGTVGITVDAADDAPDDASELAGAANCQAGIEGRPSMGRVDVGVVDMVGGRLRRSDLRDFSSC